MIVAIKLSAILSVISAILYIAVFITSPEFSRSFAIFLIILAFLLVIVSNFSSVMVIKKNKTEQRGK